MINALKNEIKRLSKRAFQREAKLAAQQIKYQKQFAKRTGLAAGVPSAKVKKFSNRHFDPRYCARNANFLSKTIWSKVLSSQYEPVPAIRYLIPKPDGSNREVMAFSIPDAALANVVLRRTRDRNTKRLSPSSYAYHPDKNVFDAILALKDYEDQGKLFAVQIDFEKYFDTIPHGYLKRRINDAQKISLTPHERFVFEKFLNHRFGSLGDYAKGTFKRRHKGTPQGSSVSLLLANIANHDLDMALSKESGKFVRFADDVLALCENYEDAQRIEKCFLGHCQKSGLKINSDKSPGIAIVAPSQEEIRTFNHFDYLGYRFGGNGLGVPNYVARRIRYRISRLVNIYLLQYLNNGFNSSRASDGSVRFDWDLLGLIYEIRNSIYGGLRESQLQNYLLKGTRLPKMRGLMGFYCLLDDPSELKSLDGWMLSIVRRAMVKRNRYLNLNHASSCPLPTNTELATGSWLDLSAWQGNSPPECRMPSFVRGWRAARKYYFTFGLEDVQAPSYIFYADQIGIADY